MESSWPASSRASQDRGVQREHLDSWEPAGLPPKSARPCHHPSSGDCRRQLQNQRQEAFPKTGSDRRTRAGYTDPWKLRRAREQHPQPACCEDQNPEPLRAGSKACGSAARLLPTKAAPALLGRRPTNHERNDGPSRYFVPPCEFANARTGRRARGRTKDRSTARYREQKAIPWHPLRCAPRVAALELRTWPETSYPPTPTTRPASRPQAPTEGSQ